MDFGARLLRRQWRARPWWERAIYLIIFSLVLVLPFITTDYIVRIGVLALGYSVLCLGLNLQVGIGGQFNFGWGTYYGVGAYTAAILITRYDVHFIVALLAAVAVTGLVGLLTAVPVRLVGGLPLAVVTLAYGEIFVLLARNLRGLTGGFDGIIGIPSPKLLGFVFSSPTSFYYLVLFLLILSLLVMWLIVDSRFGRAFMAIRDDEIAAAAAGINVPRYKILCYTLGTPFAGLAGGFMAMYIRFVGPEAFTYAISILTIVMVIVGGLGSIRGTLAGVAIMVVLLEFTRLIVYQQWILLGALIMLLMIFRPQGIMGHPGLRVRLR